jgi:hypothetical protein
MTSAHEIQPTVDNQKIDGPDQTSAVLQEAALKLFQCKDGSLVANPMSCTKTVNDLPDLEIGS